MARPRIEGMSERIVKAFIERKIFSSQTDVIEAALKLLFEHQMELDAEHQNIESVPRDEIMRRQLPGAHS